MVVWLRETLDAAGQLAEAAARETTSADWEYQDHDNRLVATSPPRFTVADVDFFDSAPGRFMADNDPAAVLRRIDRDRKTLDECVAAFDWDNWGAASLAETTIRNLAEGWGWTEETT